MPPYLFVKKLGYDPTHRAEVEADTVLHRQHIQFFGHGVHMHYCGGIVKLVLCFWQTLFHLVLVLVVLRETLDVTVILLVNLVYK